MGRLHFEYVVWSDTNTTDLDLLNNLFLDAFRERKVKVFKAIAEIQEPKKE